jgi:formate-dependent nitrite reductase cytochrome c552 subunit
MITPKKKPCKECGNVTYIFSKGRCKPCAAASYKPIRKSNKNGNENKEYYKRAWDSHKTKSCEECGKGLPEFNPAYISHIISKGSNTALRSDIRNHLLLCVGCHHKYEFGDRSSMQTYERVQAIRLELIREYYKVSKASDIPLQSLPRK